MLDKIKIQIIEMLVDHSRLIYSIISDMGVIYTTWVENSINNKETLERKLNKLKLDIEEAASIKNQTVKDFTEVITLRSGDYITLILKMDNLSNLALKFVDLLMYIELSDLNSEMKKMYHKSINTLLQMVELLKESIKLLLETPSKVIYRINEIHELGNTIDMIFHQFLNHLYKDKDLNFRSLLIIRDSIITLEQFVEKIHHIAEIIRVLHYE
ncbi:MAG: hypothetical protein ACFFEN_04830 [Candidatus Thorarchaeota archaeon]